MTINWEPGIGDPTAMGWVTVVAYFVTMGLCYRAAKTAKNQTGGLPATANKEQYFWLAATMILAFLGVNKQLDLQSLFTELARELSRLQGWYADRRTYQALFIQFLGIAGFGLGTALFFMLRKMANSLKVALLGFIFLGIFVLVRAASFHNVDEFLGEEFLGWRWNWILELTGIFTIAGTCIYYVQNRSTDK